MIDTSVLKASRDGYGRALVTLGKDKKEVVVLSADLTESTRSQDFAKEYPDRFYELGVAEQNMMSVAAGMSFEGLIPFCSSYAVFNPGRNWDQLRVSVCYSQANVKIAGHHAGITVGPDGATHQALEDIAITRVLPNLVVIVPSDEHEAYQATLTAAAYRGPVYLRFCREKTPQVTKADEVFEIGKAKVMRQGKKITLIACGSMVAEALQAAEELDAEVINMATIKPLDTKTLIKSAKKTGKVITIEEHQIIGGLGSAVCEVLSKEYPVPVLRLGMHDQFGQSGEAGELLELYGLTWQRIIKAAQEFGI